MRWCWACHDEHRWGCWKKLVVLRRMGGEGGEVDRVDRGAGGVVRGCGVRRGRGVCGQGGQGRWRGGARVWCEEGLVVCGRWLLGCGVRWDRVVCTWRGLGRCFILVWRRTRFPNADGEADRGGTASEVEVMNEWEKASVKRPR